MAKTVASIKFSYEDYKSLPESETKRYELLGGELEMTPSPTWKHQSIAAALFKHLIQFVEAHNLGSVRFAPLDVVLSGKDVIQPDLLFISNGNSHIVQGDEIRGAPDLTVEIFSPSTIDRDRRYKRTLYARCGVREYWLVDPEMQTIEVLSLSKQGYQRVDHYQAGQTLHSPLLTGLQIALDQVF